MLHGSGQTHDAKRIIGQARGLTPDKAKTVPVSLQSIESGELLRPRL